MRDRQLSPMVATMSNARWRPCAVKRGGGSVESGVEKEKEQKDGRGRGKKSISKKKEQKNGKGIKRKEEKRGKEKKGEGA